MSKTVLFLLLASASAVSLHAHQDYYWQSTHVDGSAQLLTLFCRDCEGTDHSGRDIPLIAVLRDTLGSLQPKDDRVSYVWLLTYARPSWEKRALSAVPFFYWKIGDGPAKVSKNDLKPLINVNAPQRSVVSSTLRNVVQWTVLDPLSMPVRASSRAYQNNRLDHERLHLEEAIGYLQAAPVTEDKSKGLNEAERNTVIARLELRTALLGDFVTGRRAAELGEDANLEQERVRQRNWELLRQCADKTGLFFEPINLPGAKEQYAILWYSAGHSAPQEGIRLDPVWKLLNIQDPYLQPNKLLAKPSYPRTINGETSPFIPLGVYSLIYPKMPLLMIDFNDGTHLKRHELTQRAINEITSGVIGLSRFTNWYYFVGADLYDFWASRRGTAMNERQRLTCYSKFRVALALDRSLDQPLHAAMQHRVSSFSVNPLETSAQKELAAALQRYDLLRDSSDSENSRLLRRLERDRRAELARFEATTSQQFRAGIWHYAAFGLYTRRAKGDDYLSRLRRYREKQHL